QYEGLQALHDRYADQGLIVLAVPSDDFGQELASEAEVAEFCELNYNLTLPMTEITRIKAPDAHPFFEWLAREHDARASWNFSKFLIDGNGDFVEDWSSLTGPTSGAIIRAVERELAR
ncbi:MAG: glutathione peroxidase, partial [Rhodobacteraceae bacterium]|nr:glutathione peroxidase [Paracoccaceae bacterium]